jgi:hypothetical protein
MVSRSVSSTRAPVHIREHLISPTAALENAKYRKLETEVDPREQGWKAIYSRKSSEPTLLSSSSSSADKSQLSPKLPNKKVRETSDRLLVPKEHHLWRGPQDTTPSIDAKKLAKIKPISPNDHLLKPKAAPSIVSEVEEESKTEKKKVAKPSEHLLTLTAALERGRYIKPEDRVPVEDPDDIVPGKLPPFRAISSS